MSDTRITRHTHITDPDAAFDGLQRDNDFLTAQIASLEARALSDEERAYLRNKMESDERASWAWKTLRTYAPWVTAVCSAVGTGVYWIVSNFQVRPHQ